MRAFSLRDGHDYMLGNLKPSVTAPLAFPLSACAYGLLGVRMCGRASEVGSCVCVSGCLVVFDFTSVSLPNALCV